MRQLSSSWTLAFRIFFPTLWIAFFGTFLIALFVTDKPLIGPIDANFLRYGLLVFVAIFIFIFWKTVFRLKRVDADNEYIYVTNFFKNVRYPHADIDKIELSKGILFQYGTLYLRGKGTFGDNILFILSKRRLELFLEDNPYLKDWIVEL